MEGEREGERGREGGREREGVRGREEGERWRARNTNGPPLNLCILKSRPS